MVIKSAQSNKLLNAVACGGWRGVQQARGGAPMYRTLQVYWKPTVREKTREQ